MAYYSFVTDLVLNLYARGMTKSQIQNDVVADVYIKDQYLYTSEGSSPSIVEIFNMGDPKINLCTDTQYCLNGAYFTYTFQLQMRSGVLIFADVAEAYIAIRSKTYGSPYEIKMFDSFPAGYYHLVEIFERKLTIHEIVPSMDSRFTLYDANNNPVTVYTGAETGGINDNCWCDNKCSVYATTDNPVNNPSYIRWLLEAMYNGMAKDAVVGAWKIVFLDDAGNCKLLNSDMINIPMFGVLSSNNWYTYFGVAANYYDGTKWWYWGHTTLYVYRSMDQPTPDVVTFVPAKPMLLQNLPSSPSAGTIFVHKMGRSLAGDVTYPTTI